MQRALKKTRDAIKSRTVFLIFARAKIDFAAPLSCTPLLFALLCSTLLHNAMAMACHALLCSAKLCYTFSARLAWLALLTRPLPLNFSNL